MPKNIIICCDGTCNGLTQDRTNVMRLWLALARTPGQLAYYDPGVGTLGDSGALTKLGRKLNRAIDAATGKGVRENVIEAYQFLVDHYEDGDSIYMFGFSRGAYTVRALVGMLQMCGLLSPGSTNLLPYVWQLYSNDEGDTTRFGKRCGLAAGLKQRNRQPRIHFVGVWDTVSSWGWFFNFRSLPYTSLCPQVDHIRHAVALDERRAAFRQNVFSQKNHDLREVWFPGVHADVGGGYPEAQSGIAKASFEWMMAEVGKVAPQPGTPILALDASASASLFGEKPPEAVVHQSLSGAWWILECLPRRVWVHDDTTNRWVAHWHCNFGNRRSVREDAQRFEGGLKMT